jgi:hypothetical protein
MPRLARRSSLMILNRVGLATGRWKARPSGRNPAMGVWQDQNPVSGFRRIPADEFLLRRRQEHGQPHIEVLPHRAQVYQLPHRRREQARLRRHSIDRGWEGGSGEAPGGTRRSSTGEHWDVSEFEGKEATLRLFDKEKGGWGHTLVDQIEMADVPRASVVEPWELSQFPDFGELALCALHGEMEEGDLSKALGLVDSGLRIRKPDPGGDRYPLDEDRLYGLGTAEVELPPGAKHVFTFVLAWALPEYHATESGLRTRVRSAVSQRAERGWTMSLRNVLAWPRGRAPGGIPTTAARCRIGSSTGFTSPRPSSPAARRCGGRAGGSGGGRG